jgi:hypothetical protein
LEVEEENYSEKSESSSKFSNQLTVRVNTENTLQFKYDQFTINRIEERMDDNGVTTYKLNLDQRDADEDSLLAFCPIEVYERNYLRNLQQQQQQQQQHESEESNTKDDKFVRVPSMKAKRNNDDTTMVSNSLQIPIISLGVLEKPPVVENIYTSDNITIIDTDLVPVCLLIYL